MCATPATPAFCCDLFVAMLSPHAISRLLPLPPHTFRFALRPHARPRPHEGRAHPHPLLSFPLHFPPITGARPHPLVPLAIGDSATTCCLRTAPQNGATAKASCSSAQAPQCTAPGRQRGESRDSLAGAVHLEAPLLFISRLFSDLEPSRNRKLASHTVERERVNFETGLHEEERHCQGQLSLCQSQESRRMSVNFPTCSSQEWACSLGRGCAGRRRPNRFL